ncbi:MAG TPA: proline--tRNA ligase [Gammaproteobacteria bacterium]|nr:proline--tRNA ligase [Gammaproteobacteria bacterium]
MRVSKLLMATLKESPNDAEIVSHKLMLRAGLIRKLASGLYTWLPLGLRVVRRIECIIREEMDRIGAQEILMPTVQPAELWQETERWEQYGPHLLKMVDRHKRAFCFGPTHEEVITDLMRRELKSYKQLPLSLYQIQVKFRDEIRPRFGVMRAREFLMKDAYSFHIDKASLQNTYQQFFDAYTRIFTRLGLTFRAVLADTGNIGGSVSHEFHVLALAGEDLLAYSDESDYAANVELAQSLLPSENSEKSSETLQFVTTPGIKSVDAQATHLRIETKKILKTLLVRGKSEQHPIVALLVRGDHELNPIKAEKHALVASPFQMVSVEEVQNLAHCGPGFVGPKELNIPLIADPAVITMTNFICGANKDGTHYAGFNWGRDCPEPEAADLRTVQEGDLSPDGKGTLKLIRGIEVGHIFQLGEKYTQAMNATILDESGQSKTLMMGCYGIGVTRIVAAAIEQHHDDKGIIWPAPMAPFQVILIPIGLLTSAAVKTATETLYQELRDAGIDVLLDDREERPGVMFADAELIGIPHRIVISEKNLTAGNLEYKGRRDATARLVPEGEIMQFLNTMLS